MQERELDLINRGYDKNLVESLCNYTLDDVNNISLKTQEKYFFLQ